MTFAHDLSKAKSLYRSGRKEDAVFNFLALLAKYPKNLKVRSELKKIEQQNGLVSAHPPNSVLHDLTQKIESGRLRETYSEVRTLVQKFPYSSALANAYGAVCAELGLLSEAEASLKNALFLMPANPDVCNNLGNVYRELRVLDDAIFFYEVAIALRPGFAKAHLNLGIAFVEKEMLERARCSFKEAIKANPNSGSAYRYLSMISDAREGGIFAKDVANLLASKEVGDFDRSELYFAYAKICEDRFDIEGEFDALTKGGSLKQKVIRYRREQDTGIFSRSKSLLESLDQISPLNEVEYRGPLPIFILGMPRSGSSLTEQVVSAHSNVVAGGELPTASLLAEKIIQNNRLPTEDDLRKFRASYLAKIFQMSRDANFVTDKMPQNFLHIGLIRKAIPESKIVLVTRDAQATCWSNFKHCFQSSRMGYSFDLEDTVAYYLNYREFMSSVQKRFGGKIHNFKYELLSESPKREITSLFKYLGLPVEKACFSPHQNKHVVRTASQLQVRQPIYQGSSKNWRKYKAHIQAAFELLEEV